ncbi:MAG: hypothetical protein HKN51_14200 [Saprospiraceae bacterium]|nr:hypothetical protein [Saprospiraceae bacterium]
MNDNEEKLESELYRQVVNWIKGGRSRKEILNDLTKMGFSLWDAATYHDRIKFNIYPSHGVFWTIFNIVLFSSFLILVFVGLLSLVDIIDIPKTGVLGFLFNIKTLIFLIVISFLPKLFNKNNR